MPIQASVSAIVRCVYGRVSVELGPSKSGRIEKGKEYRFVMFNLLG